MVESTPEISGAVSTKRRYYIGSLPTDTSTIAEPHVPAGA
jgi:hypothetical protein